MSRSLHKSATPWLVLLCLVCGAASSHAASTPGSPTNLLANPGFERISGDRA